MRGRGRDQWGVERAPACGLGCGGNLGPISLHLGHGRRLTFPACQQRKRGPVPGCDGTFENILTFSMDCTGGVWGSGNYPCGSGWGGRTPSILGAQN